MEDPTIFKVITPTLDGINSSSIKPTTSLMLRTKKFLMLKVVEMLKDKLSGSGEDTTKPTRNGILFMLMRLQNL
jgi:hypothetical protein